jgi:hypothetical protein
VQSGDKLEFRYDLKSSTEHALLYGRRYLPAKKLYMAACLLPVLLTVVALILLANKYMPDLEIVSREWRPLVAGLGFAAVAYLVIRLLQRVWMPIIKSWWYKRIELEFPIVNVVVEKLEEQLTISIGRVVTIIPFSEIYALLKSAKGLIVGIRTSSFFIPNEAVGSAEDIRKFAHSLKHGMTAEASARSSDF